MQITKASICSFQKYIFTWWPNNKRDLPWRRTHDPYKILVSEVMLQQTQVSRVLPKYIEFIQSFPSISDLANASPAHVLRVWKGMGYNRRALYLQKAAQMVVKDYNYQFPISERLLSDLPGVGTYTARALLVFAFKQDIAAVDTNIRQIIIHHFFKHKPQTDKTVQETADALAPKGKSWEWHQALMDYGALELRNKQISKHTNKQMKQIPFKDTKRFFRGRIIDRLREGNILEKNLVNEMNLKYKKTEEFLQSIISELKKEGMIDRKKDGYIGLPE